MSARAFSIAGADLSGEIDDATEVQQSFGASIGSRPPPQRIRQAHGVVHVAHLEQPLDRSPLVVDFNVEHAQPRDLSRSVQSGAADSAKRMK